MQDNTWVDFKAVKAVVTMEMILGHYKIDWLRKEGNELVGRCPIHDGDGERAFHVSTAKNAFNCFSCKARGNVLDFVAAIEKCKVPVAARKLAEWFTISDASSNSGKQGSVVTVVDAPPKAEQATSTLFANKPLSFQLKGIDHQHPYLSSRSITREVAEKYGVGFFPGKGSMTGRIVIPIHDEAGNLLAYAGRAIDDTEPKYKLPAGFHKSQVLFNLHRAVAGSDECVVIVEGFFDCIKVAEVGKACVALMGCSVSEAQEDQVARSFALASILLDGDEPGRKAAVEIAARLGKRMHVRVYSLPGGKQPDMLSGSELLDVLDG